ncbi:hypothetical protein [Microcoleus sp. S13_B4]|uniref:hypothetical protein n=1 Tax=Microcoleus sp. S13_B4 TaxID=3055408 RepID=UPI002FCFE0E5
MRELLEKNLNLKSKIQNLKSIDGGPHLRLRCEIKVALLAEEAAHVAQKSSCTPSASLRPKLLPTAMDS